MQMFRLAIYNLVPLDIRQEKEYRKAKKKRSETTGHSKSNLSTFSGDILVPDSVANSVAYLTTEPAVTVQE